MKTQGFRGFYMGLSMAGLCLGVAGCGLGNDSQNRSEGAAASTKQAVQSIRDAFPAARVDAQQGKLSLVYGSALSTGATPVEAAEQFRRGYATAFGIKSDDLVPQELQQGQIVASSSPKGIGLMYDRATKQYRYWLYRYGQVSGSVPVFRSALWTLVRNGGANPVVWVSSSLHDLSSFAAPATLAAAPADTGKTLRAIRGFTDLSGKFVQPPSALSSLSRPTSTVFAGTEDKEAAPRLAIEYDAQSESPPGKWHILADAASGDILHVENIIVFDNIAGTVTGNVTQGDKAMECADESGMNLEFAEVSGPGSSAFTDASGAFTFINAGTTAVTLTSLMGGQYFDINNYSGTVESLAQSVVPPGPANFVHNSSNTDLSVLAQVNGYSNTNQIRSFLLKYLPNYPVISTQVNMPVYVNRTDNYCPGNAWYDPSVVSLNFCALSTLYGYSNTSFASVNHHEYGHHIVQSGGSGQGAYGEGMGDVIASLFAGDAGLAYGFFLNQCTQPLRNADNTCQYSATTCSSCGSEVHDCGNLLSGTIWSVRTELAKTYPDTYVDLLNSLVLSSIPMHKGSAIDSSIAVALLTLDDDNANLDDGSPHYKEICAGFAAHGMTCPPLLTGMNVSPTTTLVSEGPVGGPFAPSSVVYTVKNLGPTSPIQFAVAPTVAAPWLTITNGSGQLSMGEQAQVTVAIDQAAAASLAKGGYDTTLQFTNTTDSVGNTTRTAHLQVGVPSPIFTETFDNGLGGFTLGTESTNLWHATSACASTQAGHSATGTLYFGVDSSCTFSNGLTVSGTVVSPQVQVTDTSNVKLRFNYFLATERSSYYDKATVSASINDGAYTVVASNNSGGLALLDTTGVWQAAEVDLTSLVSGLPSAKVKVQFGFNSVDSVANSYAGFYADDVQVLAFSSGCTTDAQCDDKIYCNGTEHCVSGTCSPGTSVNCSDTVSCTVDSCDESTKSCVHQANNGLCDDGQACNGTEICDPANGCEAGTPLNCDDANSCTSDSCDVVQGCKHTAIVCNDGNACTTDTCNPSTGCQVAPIVCNDGNACTTDTCDPSTGCLAVPISCNDGNACTTDTCDPSTGCQAVPISCNDGNACTTDSCNPSTGCQNVALACNDGNACTVDSCDPSTGCQTTALNCNDNNACTTDTCDPSTGCQHAAISCNDSNECTTDSCDPAAGCLHANSTSACTDDGNSCTNDVCSGGTCTHPSNGTCNTGPFVESGGQVVFEAEHFTTNTARASHTWDVTANSSASNSQVMQSNPNNGTSINTGYTTGSPQLDYSVKFTTTGTYQVWIRGNGTGSADRTCHVGVDGAGPSTSDRISGFSSTLAWSKSTLDGPVATISITTAGVHKINLWMREDGFRVDKILLTTSTSYTPTGAGPAESSRSAGCTTNANCDDANACTQDSCVSGACQNTPVAAGTACTDDGNVCTNDVCSAGACTHPSNTAACADDGSTCTNDVCSGGVCTHPSNGTCGSSPCSNYCSSPVSFSGNFQSGNLGTGATCFQTTGALNGGNCGNFVSPRTLSVNGVQMTCNNQNWSTIPPKVNGGYCVYTTAGNQAYAYVATW